MIKNVDEIDGHEANADICIIGSGLAGLTLAKELENSRLEVLVLESGEHGRNSDFQSLNEGAFVQSGLGFVRDCPDSLVNDRYRGWGGGANLWGGMVAPFEEHDFEERPWIPYSGWPFKRKDIISYYDRASTFLGIPKFDFSDDQRALTKRTKFVFDKNVLMPKRFFNATNLRLGDLLYPQLLKSNKLKFLLNSTCQRLELSDSGEIKSANVISTKSRKHFSIKAKVFILAAGAVENARLLLLSNNVNHKGVANDEGLVGRFFQGHGYTPTLRPTIFYLENDKQILSFFQNKYYENCNEFNLLRLSEKVQREAKLLNAYVSINTDGWNWPAKPDELTASLLSDYKNLMGYLSGDSCRWHSVYTTMLFEQDPNPSSRVILSSDHDFLGMRRVDVRSQISDLQKNTVVETYSHVSKYLGSKLSGKVQFKKTIEDIFNSIAPGMAKHHIGTTRMHQSPKLGVLDANCKAHYVSNLYVAGSSVFPTSSATNPTFTIVALTIRLADHLKSIYEFK